MDDMAMDVSWRGRDTMKGKGAREENVGRQAFTKGSETNGDPVNSVSLYENCKSLQLMLCSGKGNSEATKHEHPRGL